MWVLFLAAIFAAAAAGQTTITGTINNVDGTPATGTVHITLNRSCQTPGGLKIGGGNPKIVSVIAGAFSTTLYPNDTCIPNGTSYTVRYLVPRPPDGGRAKYWVVPTSGSPVSIASIEFDEAPIPGTYMPISQLTGCSNGQTITHNGTSFVCGSASGIGSLNGLTGSPQTFAKVDDTNVTLGIVSSGTTHTFTMGWTGTLAKARLPGVTAFLDAAQVYTAGMRQTFTHDATNAGIRVGAVGSNPSAPGSGDIWNNAGTLRWHNGTVSLTFESQENRNQANGYAGLGSDGRVAKANSNGQTVFADQNITYSSGSVQDMALGHLIAPERLAAELPAAGTVPSRIYIVTNAVSASSCSGTGSARSICRSNGTSYEALGGQALLWGSIGGTLSNQTDLQNALNAKFSLGASNTITTGDQDFSQATFFRVPISSGATPGLTGRIAYDTISNTYRGFNGAFMRTFAFAEGNVATASALATDPTDCNSVTHYVTGMAADGTLTCTAIPPGSYAADMASSTTWTVTGATHGLGTADIKAFTSSDDGTNYVPVENGGCSVNKTTFTVVCSFAVAQAGRILLIKGGGSGGSGTVTSVALTMPSEFSVSGSPITTSGTLAVSKANQSANNVFAGPSSGGAAAPAFRSLVAADIPAMVGDSGSGGAKGAVPAPSAGDAAAGKYLKADGSWTVPPGSGGSVWLTTTVTDIDVASMTDSCEARRTTTVAGATVGWPAIVAPPADFPEGAYIDNPPLVTAPNTVKWRVCTKGTVNPPIGTYVIYVIPPTI